MQPRRPLKPRRPKHPRQDIAHRLREAIDRVRGFRCMLCGNPKSTHAMIFNPNKNMQAKVCAPPGKVRLAIFGLCPDCASRPNQSAQAAEDLMLAETERFRAQGENN